MGLISKLFKSRTPTAQGGEPVPADVPRADDASAPGAPVPTPVVMPAYVPPEARPTPVDVFERPTVRALDALEDGERPTMVMPEETVEALARATANGARDGDRVEVESSAAARVGEERAELAELVGRLRRHNEELEQAAAGWTEDAIQRKKDVLRARGETMLAIEVQLARFGELTLVRELERLPYARKVTELERFLVGAARVRAGAPASAPSSGARG